MTEKKRHFTKEELDDLNGITSSRHGFIFPFSLEPLLDAMTVQEQGYTLSHIRHYVKTGEVKEIRKNSLPYVAYMQFIEQYKKDAPKYLVTVKVRRLSGAIGGKANSKNNT